jgi:hypothetical protein
MAKFSRLPPSRTGAAKSCRSSIMLSFGGGLTKDMLDLEVHDYYGFLFAVRFQMRNMRSINPPAAGGNGAVRLRRRWR